MVTVEQVERGGIVLVCAALVTVALGPGVAAERPTGPVSTPSVTDDDPQRTGTVPSLGTGRRRPTALEDVCFLTQHPMSVNSWPILKRNGIDITRRQRLFMGDVDIPTRFSASCYVVFTKAGRRAIGNTPPKNANSARVLSRGTDPTFTRPFASSHVWNVRNVDDVDWSNDDTVHFPRQKFVNGQDVGSANVYGSGSRPVITDYYVTVHSIAPSTYFPDNGTKLAPYEGNVQVIVDYKYADGGPNDRVDLGRDTPGCPTSGPKSFEDPADDWGCEHWYTYEDIRNTVEYVKVWADGYLIANETNPGQSASVDYNTDMWVDEEAGYSPAELNVSSDPRMAEERPIPFPSPLRSNETVHLEGLGAVTLRVEARIEVTIRRHHWATYCHDTKTITVPDPPPPGDTTTKEVCDGRVTYEDDTTTFGPYRPTADRETGDPGMNDGYDLKFYGITDDDFSMELRQPEPPNVEKLDVRSHLPRYWASYQYGGFREQEVIGPYTYFSFRDRGWDVMYTRKADESGTMTGYPRTKLSPIRPSRQYAVPAEEHVQIRGVDAELLGTRGPVVAAWSPSGWDWAARYPELTSRPSAFEQTRVVEHRMKKPRSNDVPVHVREPFPKFEGDSVLNDTSYNHTENTRLRGVKYDTTVLRLGGGGSKSKVEIRVRDGVTGSLIYPSSRGATVNVEGDALSFSGGSATTTLPYRTSAVLMSYDPGPPSWRNPETVGPIYKRSRGVRKIGADLEWPGGLVREVLFWLVYLYFLWLVSLYAYNHIWPPAGHDRSFP